MLFVLLVRFSRFGALLVRALLCSRPAKASRGDQTLSVCNASLHVFILFRNLTDSPELLFTSSSQVLDLPVGRPTCTCLPMSMYGTIIEALSIPSNTCIELFFVRWQCGEADLRTCTAKNKKQEREAKMRPHAYAHTCTCMQRHAAAYPHVTRTMSARHCRWRRRPSLHPIRAGRECRVTPARSYG